MRELAATWATNDATTHWHKKYAMECFPRKFQMRNLKNVCADSLRSTSRNTDMTKNHELTLGLV